MQVIKEFTMLAKRAVENNLPVVPTPTLTQVASFLAYHRFKERGGQLVGGQKLEDIHAFGQQNLLMVDTPLHTGGVVHVVTETLRDEPFLVMLLSTRGLLQGTDVTSPIETDETSKLIYEGYPLTVIGQSDINKSFHVR